MKRAIIVVSFGSTVENARTQNIKPVVDAIANANPTAKVLEAFTSRIIIRKLKEKGLAMKNEIEAMEEVLAEGFDEIIVQPLHLVGGEEFNKLRNNIKSILTKEQEEKVFFGRPLLFFTGQEDEYPDDFAILLDALHEITAVGEKEGVALIGHGGLSPENTAYSALQLKAFQKGYDHMRIATIECYPLLEDTVLPWFMGEKPETVHVYPLMLVAGDHALNDIAGDEDDSVVNRLREAGYKAEAHLTGLGAFSKVQDIYVQHVEDAIAKRYVYKNFLNGKK